MSQNLSLSNETHLESTWNSDRLAILKKIASNIRGLSIDAIEEANSGHPGLPLGCAEIGAYLYGFFLDHHPKASQWAGRDRFILSAGHGSMLLYSCLHLSGFNLPLDEVKRFRQLHSETPGHPEFGETDGVETTSGPLGQGIANAVGQALGLKISASSFNKKGFELFNSKVLALAGDGCIMEGVSAEASSLAGHLNLDNLILIYDANEISLDGPLSESCSEDVAMRYRSYGWEVVQVDGNDLEALHQTLWPYRSKQTKPLLVIAKTVIGKGAPNKEGSHKVHGSPLGLEESLETKKALGLPEDKFFVFEEVKSYFSQRVKEQEVHYSNWQELFKKWKNNFPEESDQYEQMRLRKVPDDLEEKLHALEIKDPIAGRGASSEVLKLLMDELPFLYGGSADLSCSDKTFVSGKGVITKEDFSGRNIKYGVREFAMAAIASGLSQSQFILPYIGTFLTFSDYMRNAIRLASLMKIQVVYQFTHDSIFLGEDGPTHQPVEHLMALRVIPGLQVIRPADQNEVKMAWISALNYQGPTAIVLSRQSLPQLEGTNKHFEEGVLKGAYIIKEASTPMKLLLIATGSEVSLSLELAQALEEKQIPTRVVSMPCMTLFDLQDRAYRDYILGGSEVRRVAIEAGSSLGWYKYIGNGEVIGVDSFGASAPDKKLKESYGFTVEGMIKRLGY